MIKNCLAFYLAAMKITLVKYPNLLTALEKQEKKN